MNCYACTVEEKDRKTARGDCVLCGFPKLKEMLDDVEDKMHM